MLQPKWKRAASLFFAERARSVKGAAPTLADLCFVSGRDPRLWSDENLYAEMIESIVSQLALSPGQKLLEVGCASGFLARGLAPRCDHYAGLDIAAPALSNARRLSLPNAAFHCGDAMRMRFPDNFFCRVLSYDVFTNFPDWSTAEAIIREMWRVASPGGRIMVGSLPDQERLEEASERASALNEELTGRFGEAPLREDDSSRIRRFLRRYVWGTPPEIACYSFSRNRFTDLGYTLGAKVEIFEIHKSNPYYGTRFNAVYSKPQ